MDILTVDNVSKTYTGHKALDSVSLSVPEGTVYGLLGPNGAGKTTLIRIINHITAPDSGLVTFDGHPLSQDDVVNIGYLPEERGLYKKMKVGDQAVFFARLKGLGKAEATRSLKEWFERFEISSWWNRKVEELSKGMAQKVQFIVTVLHRPKLLIFDEPFSGFDPVNANLLRDEILRLKNEGSTVIFSTHNMASVEEICDNISLGESTFMTEMNEASAILNNMTARSLILFDELGRGTSTYDGISIAWAIVEHIHENGRCRPKTLFATHYHELNEMEGTFQRVVNYNVSVKEIKGRVVFMRKLERGGSEHSFGIHVAKLAGMPPSIVRRAEQVLKQLETKEADAPKANVAQLGTARDGYQLSFFQLDDPLLEQIRDRLLTLQIDNLTPLQALQTLHGLQCLLTGKQP